MTRTFHNDDVCVVAMGACLPRAKSPEKFWEVCKKGESLFHQVSKRGFTNLWEINRPEVKLSTLLATEITEAEIKAFRDLNSVSSEEGRLQLYALEAARQVMKSLEGSSLGEKQDVILGCIYPEQSIEEQALELSYDRSLAQLLAELSSRGVSQNQLVHLRETALAQRKPHKLDRKHFLVTPILDRIFKTYHFKGEYFLVDAACASSLAAIDLAINRLKLGVTDFVLTGGIEAFLGLGSYVLFSHVDALAPSKSIPFDHASEGLVQAEGAVLFGLKRLQDALKSNDKIYGVIRAIEGSSDGKSSSLFQPAVRGQLAVYEKAYGKNRALHHLEAHATGTAVGDAAEAKGISSFFKEQSFPVSSSKAIYGHMRAAAGALGLLKSLMILNTQIIPCGPHVKDSVFEDAADGPYLLQEESQLPQADFHRVGVSSFGFGGANYHLIVESLGESPQRLVTTKRDQIAVGVVAREGLSLENFTRDSFSGLDLPFKIPPRSLASIDLVQLAALATVWKCIQKLGNRWKLLPREKICVVSGCSLVLDEMFRILDGLVRESIARIVSETEPALKSLVEDVISPARFNFTEDTITGVINNVIAARVCNAFDIRGKSYNIDKDLGSSGAILESAYHGLLLNADQLYIVIGVQEEIDLEQMKMKRNTLSVTFLTSETFAFQNELVLKEWYRP